VDLGESGAPQQANILLLWWHGMRVSMPFCMQRRHLQVRRLGNDSVAVLACSLAGSAMPLMQQAPQVIAPGRTGDGIQLVATVCVCLWVQLRV
jgi:hypothetical protein